MAPGRNQIKMIDILIPTVAQGLLWALGAAVAATALVNGYGLIPAFLLAAAAGALAGIVTGFFTTQLRIPALLAGILTMIGLYSVNLHVMGKANIALLRVETIFTYTESFGLDSASAMLIVGILAALLVGGVMYWFFGTEIGTAIRATGCNPQMARAQGVNTNKMILFGLLISNALVALSGALVAQSNGFADVGMGTGTIVIGLASVIIGEVLFGTKSFKNCLISVILGSIVYRLVIAIVLQLGMPPNDLKLFTALLVALALSMPLIREKMRQRRSRI